MQTEIKRDKIFGGSNVSDEKTDELLVGHQNLLAEFIRSSGGIVLRNSIDMEGSSYYDSREERNDSSQRIQEVGINSSSLLKVLGFEG
jgi:hypothetical protein